MTNQAQPYALVFGVSIYDIFGFTDTSFRAYDSNPGRVKVSYGGVCRNIAENMARINLNTKFISIVGDDEKGHSIMQHAQTMNFDMSDSLIIEGASTPTYLAILDEKGEMVSAVVDLKIADNFTPEFIDSKEEEIVNAEYMFFGADNPGIIEYIVKKYYGKTNFVLDPVSAAKAVKLKHLLPYFHTIKPNRHEAEVLCGFSLNNTEDVKNAGRFFLELGVKKVFISLDAEGIYYYDGTNEGIIKSENCSVVNVTGAGDSLVAGIAYGYLHDLPINETVKFSVAMSVITISHEATIHPNMSLPLVEECIATADWKETVFS